ncbi:sugar ABC transporter substrate-binding protein [Clostridiales bacterium COT073_COT-073]|nr:sugar ABC transporter substrate-binding protein [Clostridiales bacterium COT073_COT-073]
MKGITKKVCCVMMGILLGVTILTGCGKQPVASPKTENGKKETVEQKQGEGPKKVAFICKSYTDTFCVWVKDEIEKKSAEYKDEFSLDCLDSKNTSSTQIEQIENCVAGGYDVIIFQQVDAEAPVQAVKEAAAKGIKVIVTTGSINDDGISTYIDADPIQQGTVLAEYAVKKFPEKANVAILQGPAGNFHANGRQEGFKKVLSDKAITIVAEEIGEWQKDKAMTIVQNWLVAYPDLNVIMAHNDDMALGATEAIKMAGKEGQIQVYGVDATAAGCQALEAGKIGATVFQNAIDYAHLALKYASDYLKGQEIKSVRIDSELVTPDNVKDYIEIHKKLGNIK